MLSPDHSLYQAVETGVLRVLGGGTVGPLHSKVLPARSPRPGNRDGQVSHGVTSALGQGPMALGLLEPLGFPGELPPLMPFDLAHPHQGYLSPPFLRLWLSSVETRDIGLPGCLQYISKNRLSSE